VEWPATVNRLNFLDSVKGWTSVDYMWDYYVSNMLDTVHCLRFIWLHNVSGLVAV